MAWLFLPGLRRGSSPQRTDSLPQFLLPPWGDAQCPYGTWGSGQALPGQALSPGDLFVSPTMRAEATMPPWGTPGEVPTRSPSRLCRSRWGSEPPVPVCTAAQQTHQEGLAGTPVTGTLCAVPKKWSCRTTDCFLYLLHPAGLSECGFLRMAGWLSWGSLPGLGGQARCHHCLLLLGGYLCTPAPAWSGSAEGHASPVTRAATSPEDLGPFA